MENYTNTSNICDSVNKESHNSYSNTNTDTNTNCKNLVKYLLDYKGNFKFTKTMAYVIAGNCGGESGFNNTAENENGAYGIAQWYNVRKKNLQEYAKLKNTDISNVNLQYEFLVNEIIGNDTYKETLKDIEANNFNTYFGENRKYNIYSQKVGNNVLKKGIFIWCMIFEVPGPDSALTSLNGRYKWAKKAESFYNN